MDGRIRVGVVGLGSFGAHHARHYAGRPDAELVVVADADAARACAAAERYGAVASGSHRALIGKVDAASVTVPASFHHAVASDLIDAGIHVFVEKPLAPTPREAADLVRRAEKAGVILQVGHIERFSPVFRALRERVSAPQEVHCVRRAVWNGRSGDVDVVLDLMIHDIDLALMLLGEPVSGEATGVSSVTGFNDEVEARLVFANGAVGSFTASRVAEKGERVVRVREAGRELIADLSASSLTIRDDGGAGETLAIAAADNLAAEIENFLTSVRFNRRPEVDGRAGLAAVRVADEIILASIARGRHAPASHGDVRP